MRRGAAARKRVPVPTIIVCLLTAALLVLSLLARARLTVLSGECSALESRITELRSRRDRLLIDSERAISLAELEEYARDELGMGLPGAGQIRYIDFDEEGEPSDGEPETDKRGLLDKIDDLLREYLSFAAE